MVLDGEGFIDSVLLFPLLRREDQTEATDVILENPHQWPVASYKDYPAREGTITEILIWNPAEKQTRAIYTTGIGAGDDCGLLACMSLYILAHRLKQMGAFTRAEAVLNLELALEEV
jgi:hypothetical protein